MKSLSKLCTGAMGAVIGVSSVIVVPLAIAGPASASPLSVPCTPEAGYANCARYSYIGENGSFTVPANVNSLRVKLWGAGGGGTQPTSSDRNSGGGSGGFTAATLAVTPHTTLSLVVGEAGQSSRSGNNRSTTYGGGGASGGGSSRDDFDGASGGGMSAVFLDSAHATPLLVAGGGGGASGGNLASPLNFNVYAGGGGGGGLSGNATTIDFHGGPGTQLAGGEPPTAVLAANCLPTATAGVQYAGGTGASTLSADHGTSGGGGGGGYFGGGGGACTDKTGTTSSSVDEGGAGGGGSAYVGGAGVTDAATTAGETPTTFGDYTPSGGAADPQYNAVGAPDGPGVGPAVGQGGAFDQGGDGEIVIEWNASAAASVSAPSVMKVVTQAQTFPVTCSLTRRPIGACGVTLVYRNSTGSYVIGTGSVTRTAGSAAGQLITKVTLNATGHRLAGIAPIPTWVYASITPYGSRSVLPATARTVVQNYNLK